MENTALLDQIISISEVNPTLCRNLSGQGGNEDRNKTIANSLQKMNTLLVLFQSLWKPCFDINNLPKDCWASMHKFFSF